MATLTSKLIVSLMDRVSGPAKKIGGSLDVLHRKGNRASGFFGMGGGGAGGMVLGGAVRNLVALGAGYVGVTRGIGGTVGAAIKFEEAFADVRKVVDGTPGQLAEIRSEILGMSKTLPVTAEGIADIYAAAGQSNVPLNELGKFAEMAAKVSVAWDTSQAETGEALAKIKTQLGLSVSDLGLFADAINHLSNNTASAAPDLVDFAKRTAAVGKMFGFQATETLAFGASMVSAGAQSEVAATSFRNMGRALTKGERATKAQREAFKALGLDAVKTAKGMQKNALKTTLDVFDRIAKLPEWQRNSIASALFGDEARGLLPVIADTRELRRELAMVATEADYSGSAFQEYLVRSETTANALQLIWNKIRGVGIGIGDSWLPTVKELGQGIGDVLDTLAKRVGVLDQFKASISGFMSGIGYGGEGGVRELVNDLGDLLFGEAFGGELRDADDRVTALAQLSNRFRGIGRDLKEFSENVAGGNVGGAVGAVASAMSNLDGSISIGGALAIGATGWAMLGLGKGITRLVLSPFGRIAGVATAVATLIDAAQGAESLGEFADNLSELSAVEWGAIGIGLALIGGKLWRIARGIRAIKTAGGVASVAGGAATAASGGVALGAGTAALLGAGVVAGTGYVVREMERSNQSEARRMATPRAAEDASMRAYMRDRKDIESMRGSDEAAGVGILERLRSLDSWLTETFPSMRANTGEPSEVTVMAPVETKPGGVQDVRMTNPPPAPVINVTVNATTTADANEIASTVERTLSDKFRQISDGAYSDGVN